MTILFDNISNNTSIGSLMLVGGNLYYSFIPQNTSGPINKFTLSLAMRFNPSSSVYVELWEITEVNNIVSKVGQALRTSNVIPGTEIPNATPPDSVFTFDTYELNGSKRYAFVICINGTGFFTTLTLVSNNSAYYLTRQNISTGDQEKVYGIAATKLEYIDSGIALNPQTIPVLSSGLAVASVAVDPTTVEIKLNGQPLPTGSIIKNTITGQKFIKSEGGVTSFTAIEVAPKPTWSWSASADALWEVLQSL